MFVSDRIECGSAADSAFHCVSFGFEDCLEREDDGVVIIYDQNVLGDRLHRAELLLGLDAIAWSTAIRVEGLAQARTRQQKTRAAARVCRYLLLSSRCAICRAGSDRAARGRSRSARNL